MFDALSSKFTDIFDRLGKKGVLSEGDVDSALREIRVALLEADVSLQVVKEFVSVVKEKSVGGEVLKSVTPGQMIIKIVFDELVEVFGPDNTSIDLQATPPVSIMMVGLQGVGKTTTSAKLAYKLTQDENKKLLLVSLDVARPAAQEQLAILAKEAGIRSLSAVLGEQPVGIASRAMKVGVSEGYDIIVFDTAGRLAIDQELMRELSEIKNIVTPKETILVADALSGQDAVNTANEFNSNVGLTGVALTRVDGDSRGGAALSIRASTGCPIKLMGVGEKLGDLENFDAERIAGRILGKGDIVGLVEKASQVIDETEAKKSAERALKGKFTLEDLGTQLSQVRKMGDMKGIMGMLPGIGKIKKQVADANIDDKMISHQEAIIFSMTPLERKNPKLLNGKRRKRIAAGSGTSVQEVNRLLKQHKQMAQMMKKMGKSGGISGLDASVMGQLNQNFGQFRG